MAAYALGRRSDRHPPDAHQLIRACTCKLGAIRTPGHVVQPERVPLHDTHALPTCHVPHAQGTIFTATEQALAVGREGKTIHRGSMSLQPRSRAASLCVPEPNCGVKASTG